MKSRHPAQRTRCPAGILVSLLGCFLFEVAHANTEPGEALLRAAQQALQDAAAPRGRRAQAAKVASAQHRPAVKSAAKVVSTKSQQGAPKAAKAAQTQGRVAVKGPAAKNQPGQPRAAVKAPRVAQKAVAPAQHQERESGAKSPTSAVAAQKNIRQTLIDELFLGVDPLTKQDTGASKDFEFDAAMTHVSSKDIDMVLEYAVQPVTFWLELGSYEGGSAILTSRRIKERAAGTSVLAVDTFLGDTRTLWEREATQRRQLLREDGTISLYARFCENVRRSKQDDIVLPLPATSIVALRLISSMAAQGTVPAPQVIYLDSAHEEGEVFLELQAAWKTLAPGGIMFGDDWVLPPSVSDSAEGRGDGNMVQRDVLSFAELHADDLDDTLGPQVQAMRTLGRPRPGVFVSYQSFQWFIRKRKDADTNRTKQPARPSDRKAVGFDCWSDGFEQGDCCDVEKFGAGGNPKCWDLVFTFEQCCQAQQVV